MPPTRALMHVEQQWVCYSEFKASKKIGQSDLHSSKQQRNKMQQQETREKKNHIAEIHGASVVHLDDNAWQLNTSI
ncbi:MAG: hypothetical protein EZS28_029048 [Streblomastix strix]|uniref:Uncharacterized protein n=1 Tax=Streblomastix strix TaxID=222440 RepID=A0A5J4UXH0_9EUKA|nr:MAG: hypothetical protein EZS28_029048 [Streblomastix strix]